MPGWAAIGVGATAGFGGEDLAAPIGRAHWYHRQITEDAASAEGWSAGALAELGWHVVGVDLYAYHPLWRAGGGPARWRGVRWAREALPAVHFDDLGSTAQIAEVFDRVTGGMVAGVGWAAGAGDVGAARQVIGVGLHAVQDFYSHSTWIDDPGRRTRTWSEVVGGTAVEAGPRTAAEAGPRTVAGAVGGAVAGSGGLLDPHLSTGGHATGAGLLPHRHGDTVVTAAVLGRLPAMLTAAVLDRGRDRRRRAAPGGGARQRGPFPGIRYGEEPGINLDSRWQAEIGVRTRGLSAPALDGDAAPDRDAALQGDTALRGDAALDGDAAFALALALAVRETRARLADLHRRFATDPRTSAFWSQVRCGPQQVWTDPWDDPATRAYDFVAAGTYPPQDRREAAQRFVRVLLRPAAQRPGWLRLAARAEAGFGARIGAAGDAAVVPVWVLDRDGEELAGFRLPLGRAASWGPVPDGAASLALTAPGPGHLLVHSFRRGRAPELTEVADRLLDAPGERIRCSL